MTRLVTWHDPCLCAIGQPHRARCSLYREANTAEGERAAPSPEPAERTSARAETTEGHGFRKLHIHSLQVDNGTQGVPDFVHVNGQRFVPEASTLADDETTGRLRYVAECVRVHADKFPVPSHMRAHAQFLDDLAAERATGEVAPDPAQGARTCRDAVEAWSREHLATMGDHWGDEISWDSARKIASRLDALGLPSAAEPAGDWAAWIERYTGLQDPRAMRFGLDEMKLAYSAGVLAGQKAGTVETILAPAHPEGLREASPPAPQPAAHGLEIGQRVLVNVPHGLQGRAVAPGLYAGTVDALPPFGANPACFRFTATQPRAVAFAALPSWIVEG